MELKVKLIKKEVTVIGDVDGIKELEMILCDAARYNTQSRPEFAEIGDRIWDALFTLTEDRKAGENNVENG